MKRCLRTIGLSGLLFFAAGVLFSADIAISELQLITRGIWSDAAESVVLDTRGESELEVSGGYKFGGSMSFGFTSGDLSYAGEDPPNYLDDEYQSLGTPDDAQDAYLQDLSLYLDNRTSLDFLGAEIVYRDIGGEGTDLTYFIGRNDRIASGEDFIDRFGTLPFTTKYQGYFYFPVQNYRGIHRVRGTGLRFTSPFGTERHLSAFYLYQDDHEDLDPGTYSTDYRALFHFDQLQFEYFAGSTFPKADYGVYRTGFLLYYNPSDRGDFFAQVGVPYWESMDQLTIEHFYFLFEPRIHFDPLSIILTLFWHPKYYAMAETGDFGDADIHFNFLFGNPLENQVTGGLETTLQINTDDINKDFGVVTSPYLQANAGGVVWNFAVNVTLLPYDLETLVEGVVGIKAEF